MSIGSGGGHRHNHSHATVSFRALMLYGVLYGVSLHVVSCLWYAVLLRHLLQHVFLGALYRLGRIMAFYLSVVSPRACVLPHYLLYKQTCIGTCMSAYLFKDTV